MIDPEKSTRRLKKSADRRIAAALRWVPVVALLGVYLTLRGYHSRDGDQAYRLPLLLRQQSSVAFEDDPFVRAFDEFNPHRGALLLLDGASRLLGLSGGLFILFALTFLVTFAGIDRLARRVYTDSDSESESETGSGRTVGLLAFILLLTAKAGNIGTNHLFESMLLDRLQAFALGWAAIAAAVAPAARARGGLGLVRAWTAPAALCLAALIHPSAGLQLAMVLGSSWLVWALAGGWTGVSRRQAVWNFLALGPAVVPGLLLNGSQPGTLLNGLSPDDYWTLAVELQSPQHMLPHLWRFPQWIAWGCYFVLATIAVAEIRRANRLNRSTIRLVLMLGAVLAGLAGAWVGVELQRDVRITVFQPFRMATIARGLALILISVHVRNLWVQRGRTSRLRAVLLVVGLTGDRLLAVVAAVEAAAWGIERARSWSGRRIGRGFGSGFVESPIFRLGAVAAVLLIGLRFLARHDTESGHVPLLAALGLGGLALARGWDRRIDRLAANGIGSGSVRRVLAAAAVCWAVPLLALAAASIPEGTALARSSAARALVDRCRFLETPIDDVERLAVWCRENTPETARFIGPPGPKTFRLWSHRSLAFNRASSPYHAAGLADWFERFREHVDFSGSAGEFVRRYVGNRHAVESRYQTMSPPERARLALRQGASHVVAAAPAVSAGVPARPDEAGPLELLHVEGRYAVYRVRSEAVAAGSAAEAGDQRQR